MSRTKKSCLLVILTALVLLLVGAGYNAVESYSMAPKNNEMIISRNHAVNGDEDILSRIADQDILDQCKEQHEAAETDGKKIYNFGWNPAGVAQRKGVDLETYVWSHDENGNVVGDFTVAMHTDPYAFAGNLVNYVHTMEPANRIVEDDSIWGKKVAQQPNALADWCVKHQDLWQQAADEFIRRLDTAEVSVYELDDYTSSMYQIPNGFDKNRPEIVVRNSSNTGGHAIAWTWGKDGKDVVKVRIECGYQPFDTGYWAPPEGSDPVPDNPDPDPNPNPDPDKPTLEPKDPNGGPQGQGYEDHPDFGGGPNRDNDKTVTSEPTSPSTYEPPKPPKADESTKPTGGGQKHPDKPKGDPVNKPDYGNGGYEKPVKPEDQFNDGKPGKVEAPTDPGDLNDQRQEQTSDPVQPPISGGVNQGDPEPIE